MPKCKINGHEVEVPEGTTIIEAFKKLEEDIAHYCYHPGLSVAGVCRLCMVKVEGNPRLQIACNTVVQEGMVISNQDEEVKETVRWGLDFHLINHPLDCPICDQAGECELQIQYMKFGQYDPEMAENKVKKRKVVSLGDRVVLDSERCILCSRCVRFTDEVTETHELGIFNRGDRSEIGTFKDKPLNNNYSLNTVDICPVGALTSKDFRFRQRVWYLKEKPSVCNGCSKGCNVKAYYNEEGVFRLRPRHNKDVNGYWMCDEGRETYLHTQKKNRFSQAQLKQEGVSSVCSPEEGVLKLKSQNLSKVAVVLTGQYTCEEYEDLLPCFQGASFYHWLDSPEKKDEFDGILLRGDRNPNTKGMEEVLKKHNISVKTMDSFQASGYEAVVVLAPETTRFYFQMEKMVQKFSDSKKLFWFSTTPCSFIENFSNYCMIPTKSFLEKDGTFVNHEGQRQKIEKVSLFMEEPLDLSQVSLILKGEKVEEVSLEKQMKSNKFINKVDSETNGAFHVKN